MRMDKKIIGKPNRWISNLRDLVQSSAELFGDKVLYVHKEENTLKEFTYNNLHNDMLRMGAALYDLNLLGKRIAVIGEVHPAYTTTYLTCVNGNGVIVPLDREVAPEQLVGLLRISQAEAIVYTPAVADKIKGIISECEHIRYFIPVLPGENETGDKILPYQDLLKKGDDFLATHEENPFLATEIDMEKMCAILFTSGTTGTSKGVMLSQKNLTAAINASAQSTPFDSAATLVSVLPAHHTYEMTCGNLTVILIGATVLVNDSIRNVMKNFSAFKPNTLTLVPLFIETMHKKIWSEIRKQGKEKTVRTAMKLNAFLLGIGIDIRQKLFGKITAAFGGNLRCIISGGAPISPEIITDFYHFGISVLEGYGITECAPLVAVSRSGKVRLHSVGPTVHGCQAKIDYDPGQPTGEILVYGDNVMLGYYENPEATKEVFTDDGWFHTGDIGYMDKDGYIYITGRKKNVIILSNGKNIFPEEIEEYLAKIPQIKESVVVCRTKESGEQIITAILVPDVEHPDVAGKNEKEVYALLNQEVMKTNKKLHSFKHIALVELRNEPFEKNTSQKIKRFLIK